jgi:tetratricopeptide (TPR) repeat protein
MKFKFLLSFLLGGALFASAQGYKDGIQYFRADQPEEAEIILKNTLNNADTDKATALYYLGEVALTNGNKAQAKSYFDQGIQVNAENGLNYVGLGQLALTEGNKSAADELFKQAAKLDKKNAELLTDIARSYYNADALKYAKDIQKYIADAKKADKNNPMPYILEADMKAPVNVGEAAGYYEMAYTFDTKLEHPEAYVKYARTYFHRNPEFAIEQLKKLVELQPNSALAQRELAEKYYDNNQLTLAAKQYGKYMENPNHFQKDEQRYVGLLFFGKDYEKSYKLAGEILAKDPDNFYMKRMRFLNSAAMKNQAQAMADANIFFSSNGEFVPNDYTTYGEVLQDAGENDKAVEQYEKAVAIAPDRANLLSDLSQAYTLAGQYGKAVEAQEKYIAAGEYSTNDLVILARRYQNAAATSEPGSAESIAYATKGVEVINEVDQRVPDNIQVLMTKARLQYFANGKKAGAEFAETSKHILSLLDADEANKTSRNDEYRFVLSQLGNYYLDQKDAATAKVYFGRYLEFDPDNTAFQNFYKSLK